MITIRPQEPQDLAGLQQVLYDAGFPYEAWSLQHPERVYTRFVAVDDDGTVLGMIDGHLVGHYSEWIAEHIAPPRRGAACWPSPRLTAAPASAEPFSRASGTPPGSACRPGPACDASDGTPGTVMLGTQNHYP